MNYSFPVADKISTMQLLWNLWIFDKKQKSVIIGLIQRFKSMEIKKLDRKKGSDPQRRIEK